MYYLHKMNREFKPTVLVLGTINLSIYSLLGSLLYLSYTKLLNNIKTYIGVSISSIYSLLLACGYEPYEIATDNAILNIINNLINSMNLTMLFRDSCLLQNKPIRDYLNSRIKSKFGMIPTFKQLYEMRNVEFVSVTVNITNNTTEYLSRDNYPNMSIVDGCIMSLSFPLLMEKFIYNGCVYIDGSFGNPYPIDYMDDNNVQILGIVVNNQKYKDGLLDYILTCFNYTSNEIRKRIIENSSPKCLNIVLDNSEGIPEEVMMKSINQTKLLLHNYIKNNTECINE